jgi:signal transduction histidine kinase
MKKYSLILKIKIHARFISLLCFALVATVLSGIYFIRYVVKPSTGLVMNYMEVVSDKGAVIFSPRTPFSPAVAAGLIPNRDEILKINNNTIHSIRDVLELNSRIWSFKPFPVEVMRDGKQKIKIYITPEPNLLRADWLVTLFFLFVLGFMAYYLILNHRHEPYNVIATITALLFMIFICAQPFYFENVFTLTLIYLGETVSWLLVVFALYYPKPKFNRLFRRGLLIGITLLYAVYIFLRTRVFIQWIHSRGDTYYNQVIFLGQLQNMSDLLAYALFLGFIIHTYVKSAGINIKKHIEWIAAGAFITIPTYVFFDQLPFILGETPGQRMGMGSFANFFLAFLPLFYIIGLIKAHKLNLQVLNRRSVISLFLALMFLAVFAFVYRPFENMFVQSYGMAPDVAGFMVSLALFITLFLLYSFLFWVIERYFFRVYRDAGAPPGVNLIEVDDADSSKSLFSLQKEKIHEFRSLFTGMWNRVNISLKSINGSVLTLSRDVKKNSADIKTRWADGIIEKAIADVRHGSMAINDFMKKFVSFTGQQAAIPISIDLETIISSACEQIKVRIPEINLEVAGQARVKLFCYPEEMILILLLLFENAFEALTNKHSVISVKSANTPQFVRIDITDNGTGISEKIIDKIFDPFFTIKKDHDGLGLFFCRLLVEKNWGRIEIRSVQNKQTTVSLYLSQQQGI